MKIKTLSVTKTKLNEENSETIIKVVSEIEMTKSSIVSFSSLDDLHKTLGKTILSNADKFVENNLAQNNLSIQVEELSSYINNLPLSLKESFYSKILNQRLNELLDEHDKINSNF
jgi:hypothetical protein